MGIAAPLQKRCRFRLQRSCPVFIFHAVSLKNFPKTLAKPLKICYNINKYRRMAAQ